MKSLSCDIPDTPYVMFIAAADVLLPNRRQMISNHQADCNNSVTEIILRDTNIPIHQVYTIFESGRKVGKRVDFLDVDGFVLSQW